MFARHFSAEIQELPVIPLKAIGCLQRCGLDTTRAIEGNTTDHGCEIMKKLIESGHVLVDDDSDNDHLELVFN